MNKDLHMMSDKFDDDGDTAVITDVKPKTKRPPLYKVMLLNDDFTPMEFVTWALMEYFNKTEFDAQSITLEVHKLGFAVAGVYDYQMAEQKIYEVLITAKEQEFPLQVTGEAE